MAVELIRNFCFFGSVFLFLLALGQLTLVKKQPVNWLYMVFYFCVGCLELGAWNVKADLTYAVPALSYFDMTQFWLIGPIMYMIWHELIEGRNFKGAWKHVIIPAAAGIATLPYYLTPAAEKTNRLINFFENPGTLEYEHLFAAGGLWAVLYIVFNLRNLSGIWTRDILRNEKPAQVIVIIMTMAVLVAFWGGLGLLLNDFIYIRIAAVIIAIGAAGIFLIGFRVQHFNQTFQQVVSQSKYKKSYIKDLDLKKLQKDLDRLMKEEQIYRDEELTLSSLSKELSITVHQLSQYINEKLGKNFSVFVNEYRIEEAKKLMAEEPDMNILRIAYEVGFNSKTSFNRYFGKFVGISPIQFRNKLKS